MRSQSILCILFRAKGVWREKDNTIMYCCIAIMLKVKTRPNQLFRMSDKDRYICFVKSITAIHGTKITMSRTMCAWCIGVCVCNGVFFLFSSLVAVVVFLPWLCLQMSHNGVCCVRIIFLNLFGKLKTFFLSHRKKEVIYIDSKFVLPIKFRVINNLLRVYTFGHVACLCIVKSFQRTSERSNSKIISIEMSEMSSKQWFCAFGKVLW